MAIVTLFSTTHSRGEEIAQAVAAGLQYRVVTDEDVIRAAAKRFEAPANKLAHVLAGSRSIWDKITGSEAKHASYMAYIRSALTDLIGGDQIVYHGLATPLLGRELLHVLRVCVVAKEGYRVSLAVESLGLSESAAKKRILKDDEERSHWATELLGANPWEKSSYDVFIPIDTMTVKEAADLICASADKPAVRTGAAALAALEDYGVTCAVYVALADGGHRDLQVTTSQGRVTVTINRYVMRLQHLKDEVTRIAMAVPGVRAVDTQVGPDFHPPDIYAQLDVDVPKKILLVDDEREFVVTLSERLQARSFESAVAYDGEEALAMVESDAPEVMVLDLKMPGIDGLEVLRRVKKKNPSTEVIILTGHGSKAEEDAAHKLGAFAYLQKPVDIDRLAEAMKSAYAKIKRAREGGGEER